MRPLSNLTQENEPTTINRPVMVTTRILVLFLKANGTKYLLKKVLTMSFLTGGTLSFLKQQNTSSLPFLMRSWSMTRAGRKKQT